MGRVHPCCSEEKKLRKGLWSPEEDERLASHIARFGVSCWSSIPELAGLQRCGKSCRLRWMNYLRPDLKRGRFSPQEEELIMALHKALGNSWSQIAARLPGRSDNEIKNFWNARQRKRLRQKEASSTAGSKDDHRRGGDADDDLKTPAMAAFNPFPSPEDRPRPAGHVAAAPVGGGAVLAAAAVTPSPCSRNNAAAAEPPVAPSPASTTTEERRGCDDDGFFRAMVDDASRFLLGDLYDDADGNHDMISFWEGHAFS
ncbi:hypothetical protein ACP4OV_022122 [Aristida adscensionis]